MNAIRETLNPPLAPHASGSRQLAARLEPFDSYWQAPSDIESGYGSFAAYYRANYLGRLPQDRQARILVISCGPGYLVNLLRDSGYQDVTGIDSDPVKIGYATKRGLNCKAADAFGFLEGCESQYDVIIPEQETNHLTLDETIEFLHLSFRALRPGGKIIAYAMNGANPLVGSENISHNIDHFYNLTDHSFGQLLKLGGFTEIRTFPLHLYVFWKNPLNYVGLVSTFVLETFMRVVFVLYGKKVHVLSKKIAAEGIKPR